MKQRILQHFRRRWFYYIALGLVGLLILDQLHAGGRLDVFSAQREIPTLVLDAGHGGFDGGAVLSLIHIYRPPAPPMASMEMSF